MATDYDAPREDLEQEGSDDSPEELKARRSEVRPDADAADPTEAAENFELPGADLSGEELTVKVLPQQQDEFTCSKCFLVQHRNRFAEQRDGALICRDCA